LIQTGLSISEEDRCILIDDKYTKIDDTEAWMWVAMEPVQSSFGKEVYTYIYRKEYASSSIYF
jgi:hypothetical protein